MAFVDSLGNYYEGDRASALDTQVPQRPSRFHFWSGAAWVLDQAKADAAAAVDARRSALDAEAGSDPLIDRLRNATVDQIKTWINNNVTDLPTARAVLARLAVAVAFCLKGGRDQ